MDKEPASTFVHYGHRDQSHVAPGGILDTNLPVVHECVSLYKFEQMCFDVYLNVVVRMDDGAGLGIHVIPMPAHLGLQPAAQWAE